MLTEYSRKFAQKSDADDLLPLDSITCPAKEESEQHPGKPRGASRGAALRQFESQRFGQVQHKRILVEEQ